MESVKHIERLLEKYFEATTTVAEEQELQDYFSGKDIVPHLVEYTPMFQYFAQASEERYTKKVPMRTRTVYHLKRWVSVAAVAVLTLGIYFGNQYYEKKQTEYAYQETKAALELIGQNFNKGTEKIAYLNEFENTKNKIFINTNN